MSVRRVQLLELVTDEEVEQAQATEPYAPLKRPIEYGESIPEHVPAEITVIPPPTRRTPAQITAAVRHVQALRDTDAELAPLSGVSVEAARLTSELDALRTRRQEAERQALEAEIAALDARAKAARDLAFRTPGALGQALPTTLPTLQQVGRESTLYGLVPTAQGHSQNRGVASVWHTDEHGRPVMAPYGPQVFGGSF